MTRRKPGFYLCMQFFDSWNRASSVVAGPYTSVDKAFDATIANRNFSGAYTASTLYRIDEQGHESAVEGHPRHRKERENWQEWREEQRRREERRDAPPVSKRRNAGR